MGQIKRNIGKIVYLINIIVTSFDERTKRSKTKRQVIVVCQQKIMVYA